MLLTITLFNILPLLTAYETIEKRKEEIDYHKSTTKPADEWTQM